MTRIGSTPGIVVGGLGMTGATNHARLFQHQSEGISQSDLAKRAQPISGPAVTESENRSLPNRLGLGTNVLPSAIGKPDTSTDVNRKLNPTSER
jgi:hypothetical protein